MTRRIKCPTCQKETTWENNPWRPFCSERCKLIDLGEWANENHKIPGQTHSPLDDEDDPRLN